MAFRQVCVMNDRERIAKLMGKQRQKIVFLLLGRPQLGLRTDRNFGEYSNNRANANEQNKRAQVFCIAYLEYAARFGEEEVCQSAAKKRGDNGWSKSASPRG